MFTVIICDKKIIDDCKNKYYIYLRPFMNNPNFAFCQWNVEGNSLDEAAPELRGLVDKKKEWRAIVVLDQYSYGTEQVAKRNPFDYVDYTKMPTVPFQSVAEIEEFQKQKQGAVSKALTNPLAKLAIWLSGYPVKTASLQGLEELPNVNDDSYFHVLEEKALNSVEVECRKLRAYKLALLKESFEKDGELFNPPKQFYAVSERVLTERLEGKIEETHTEYEYSRFYEDNMYPSKLRYLLFDIMYVKKQRKRADYFNFLVFLLAFANTESPLESIKRDRVYLANAVIDDEKIQSVFGGYIGKLKATLSKIEREQKRNQKTENEPIDNATVRENFESDITIPVSILDEFDKKHLMAQYDELGLAKDCPKDEGNYWASQYHQICKMFVRYLREPRRALKRAVDQEFHTKDTIEDDRVLKMDEFQQEDVQIHLLDEEQNMVETVTTQLFNTDEYNKKVAEADENIKRGIGQRMTRKKTILIGLIAGLAYLFGFLPLVFGNRNNTESLNFSVIMTVVAILLFLVCGFIFIIVLRHRLVNRFKHFNYVMSGICSEVENGLQQFSKYLSHACNVMRDCSVLNYIKNPITIKEKILKKHEIDICARIQEVMTLFGGCFDFEETGSGKEEPYDFDFTVLCDYEYEIPYSAKEATIEMMQPGHEVVVPVDYIKTITLTREELYD